MCVCVSVCLSGRDKLLRSLHPASYSAYRLYKTKPRFDFAVMYGLKNAFHGDPRPSLWRVRVPLDQYHVGRKI